MDLASLAADLRAKRVSAVELQSAAHALASASTSLNAFISLHPDHSATAATKAQASIEAGTASPLSGIPIAYKDNFCTAGIATTCATKILAGYEPPYESHVTSLLNEAGAVNIGKSNMDEFAMGTTGENSSFGATANPWNQQHCAGGSSSGSAAAVAARIVPIAIGTDTGGSVRMPASYCGICGIKPTYGNVSRRGIVAYASSLDQAGAFATSAKDLRTVLEVIINHDPAESTSLPNAALAQASDSKHTLAGKKIGIAEEFFAAGVDSQVASAVKAAIDELANKEAEIVPVSIPHLDHAIDAYYIIACAEASSNLARYDGLLYGQRAQAKELTQLIENSRTEGLGDEVKRRIMLGSFVLSHGYVDAYYRQAQKVRQMLVQDFNKAFDVCDMIATPAAPTTAPPLGAFSDNPVLMYSQDICTVTANLCGLPALSIPCGMVGNLPVGMQLIGPAHTEGDLLDIAERYQETTGHHTLLPPGIEAA